MTAMSIKINLPQNQKLCIIKPLALIKIFLHAHRFWSKNNPKSQYAYGILVGSSSAETRTIEKVVPILHAERSEVVFDESFEKHWMELNELEEELESGLYNIGWYKVIDTAPMKFRARDIRNQVKIQAETPDAVAMLLDPEAFFNDEGYGFSFFRLVQGTSQHLHEMCEDEKIPWEVAELGNDVDKVVSLLAELITKYDSEDPYIEEIDESGVPDAGGYDWSGDDDYVTPDFDPNQPAFF